MLNSNHIKILVRFFKNSDQRLQKQTCCFCIDCRFIFGFHTHDWTLCKALVSLDCSPETDGRAVCLSFYALIFIQLILMFFCWNYYFFFLTWARDLKCWLLLCAYWVEEWAGEGGAGGFAFQGLIELVPIKIEAKNEKAVICSCVFINRIMQ